MIVECHSCGASYNISDERVRGRRVRVRCKGCNEAIIIDGTELDADVASDPRDATGVYSPGFDPQVYGADGDATRSMSPGDVDWREAGGEATRVAPQKVAWQEPATDTSVVAASQLGFREAGPSDWVVNLSDTDQRTMSPSEILSAHRSGLLGDAFFWRDGMGDWRPGVEIPEIRELLGLASSFAHVEDTDEATQVVKPLVLRRPVQRAAVAAPKASAPVSSHPPPRAAGPATLRASEPPRTASRPSSPRAATARSGPDLFERVDVEGGEEELESSSVSLGRYDTKATGARNESSVLFSLNTLKATAEPSAPRRASGPETAADILGLSAAGALPGMSATAALLSAPAAEMPAKEPAPRSRMDTTPPARKGGTPWVLALAAVTVAIAVVAAAVMMARSRAGSEASRAIPPPVQAVSAAPSPAPLPSEKAVGAAEAPAPPATGSAVTPAPAIEAPTASAAPRQASPTEAAPGPRPTSKTGAAKDVEAMKAALLAGQSATAKPTAEPAPGTGKDVAEHVVLAEEPQDAPPFDAAAAKAALGGAAAQAASCKTADGPTGKGQVQVTFAPTGNTTAATVTDATFAGTPVGACVGKLFRAAKVPAFSGASVTVSKSFAIE